MDRRAGGLAKPARFAFDITLFSANLLAVPRPRDHP